MGSEITHPEILKTERFGSRHKERFDRRCYICGRECGDSFFVNAVGRIFCSTECIEKRFKQEDRK